MSFDLSAFLNKYLLTPYQLRQSTEGSLYQLHYCRPRLVGSLVHKLIKMAKVSNTLIGKTRGSVGNVTFTVWKGRNVIKEKSNAPANPNTLLQQAQRAKFKRINKYVGLLDTFFVDVWSFVSLNITHQNYLSKKMFPYASQDSTATLTEGVHEIAILPSSGYSVETVSIDSNPGPHGNITIVPSFPENVDPVSVLGVIHIYNTALDQWQIAEVVSTSGWSVSLSKDTGGTGSLLEVAVFFTDLNGVVKYAQVCGHVVAL